MTSGNQHDYQVGDAILANLNDARIPGVIEDVQGGRVLVRLADPWIDDAGLQSDTQWLSDDLVEPYVNSEGGSEQALPKPQ